MSGVSAPACTNGVWSHFAACECGAEEQIAHRAVLQCPIHWPPNGLHGLTVLDDETIERLLNTCWCGQAVDSNNALERRRAATERTHPVSGRRRRGSQTNPLHPDQVVFYSFFHALEFVKSAEGKFTLLCSVASIETTCFSSDHCDVTYVIAS